MKQLIKQIPRPKGEHIRVLEVKSIPVPHLYCITPKHLTGKSMFLNKEAIRDAEKNHSAVCDTCRYLVKHGKQKEILSIDEHLQELTLFLEVPKGDLNAILGLKEYLIKIKPVLQELKIGGVAFKQV